MMIGALIAAGLFLLYGVIKIVTAISYVSIIDAGTVPFGGIAYIADEAAVPLGFSFTLAAFAGIFYIFMHLGKPPKKRS